MQKLRHKNSVTGKEIEKRERLFLTLLVSREKKSTDVLECSMPNSIPLGGKKGKKGKEKLLSVFVCLLPTCGCERKYLFSFLSTILKMTLPLFFTFLSTRP